MKSSDVLERELHALVDKYEREGHRALLLLSTELPHGFDQDGVASPGCPEEAVAMAVNCMELLAKTAEGNGEADLSRFLRKVRDVILSGVVFNDGGDGHAKLISVKRETLQ